MYTLQSNKDGRKKVVSIIIVKNKIIYIEKRLKGGQMMTVGSQVKQTIAGLKSAQASFEQFALQTENKQAKQLYEDAAQQTMNILNSVEPRVKQIEQEEPQYKGF